MYAAYPLHALCLTLLICGLFAACATSAREKEHDEIAAPKKSLEAAAAEGDVDAVRQHIAAGTDPNTQHLTNGSKPLIVEPTIGHTEVARALIQRGADLEIQNSDGATERAARRSSRSPVPLVRLNPYTISYRPYSVRTV